MTLYQHLRRHPTDVSAIDKMLKIGDRIPLCKFGPWHYAKRRERLATIRANRMARNKVAT